MSCQRHPDRPRRCPCFLLCEDCYICQPISCTCEQRRFTAKLQAEKEAEEARKRQCLINPPQPEPPKLEPLLPTPPPVSPPPLQLDPEVFKKIEEQAQQLKLMEQQYLTMKLEYSKVINVQNRLIDELQHELTVKPEQSAEVVATAQDILHRAESILTTQESKTAEPPKPSRLEELAKPKNSKAPVGKAVRGKGAR